MIVYATILGNLDDMHGGDGVVEGDEGPLRATAWTGCAGDVGEVGKQVVLVLGHAGVFFASLFRCEPNVSFGFKSSVEIINLELVKKIIVTAGMLGASGVLLGALGAHGLKEIFETEPRKGEAFVTAVDYHLLHSVALLALGVAVGSGNAVFSRRCASAAWVMVAGVCLFCGSIYGWTFGGPSWLVHITPFGGVTLVVAWFLTVWSGLGLTCGDSSANIQES